MDSPDISLNKLKTKTTFTRDRTCSGPFGIGSTMVRIYSVYTRPVRSWNGAVLYGITFMSGPIWYHIADPFLKGSNRSRINTRLIRTNFLPVPNRSSGLV